MGKSNVCPNPECLRHFDDPKAAFVHLGNSRKCRAWERQWNNDIFEGFSDSDAGHTDSSFDEENVCLPWRKIAPLPKRAQSLDSEVPDGFKAMFPVDEEPPDGAVASPPHANEPELANPTSEDTSATSSTKPSYIKDVHPTAAHSSTGGETILDKIRSDSIGTEREKNLYHPFRDSDDFEMGAWLIRSGISMAEIDKFLKLPWVSNNYFSVEQRSLTIGRA